MISRTWSTSPVRGTKVGKHSDLLSRTVSLTRFTALIVIYGTALAFFDPRRIEGVGGALRFNARWVRYLGDGSWNS